jgi:hypothetical protein
MFRRWRHRDVRRNHRFHHLGIVVDHVDHHIDRHDHGAAVDQHLDHRPCAGGPVVRRHPGG